MGQLIVVLIRLVVPLSIFRWPLAGGIAAVAVDALDVVLIEVIDLGGFGNYAALDKALDTYYLSFEMIVSLGWTPLAKWTSVSLFVYRVVGVIAFEITQTRWLLLVFPNVFENFYLVYLTLIRLFPAFQLTPRALAALLVAVTVPKLAQEWLLHYAEAQPWDWIKTHILRDTWRF